MVLLASSIASVSSANVCTVSTGPNTSCCTTSLSFEAGDTALVPVVLDESALQPPLHPDSVETSTGAVLNYNLFVDGSRAGLHATGQYDFRFISRYGVGQTTGFANWRPPSKGGFVHKRLQGFQQNVAQMYGSEVGAEMLRAATTWPD